MDFLTNSATYAPNVNFFDKITKDDGMNYYIIPTNTMLYRAENSIYRDFGTNINEYQIPDKIYFLGVNPESVQQYGIVYEFKTDREYNLLALDDDKTLDILYNKMDTDMQNILVKNYGYDPITKISTKNRDSVLEKDMALSRYLCGENYDGYATNEMTKDDNTDTFHKEIMICHPSNLKLIRQVTTDKSTIDNILDDSILRKTKKTKNKRLNQNNNNNSSPPKRFISNNLFGDSPPSSPEYFTGVPRSNTLRPPIQKTLFNDEDDDMTGGKKRKTYKKRKTNKKANKKRKTNKKRKQRKI